MKKLIVYSDGSSIVLDSAFTITSNQKQIVLETDVTGMTEEEIQTLINGTSQGEDE